MRYWDTSAVVPLEIDERGSDLVRTWLREDPAIATWGLTRLEIASAIERRAREGVIGTVQRREIVARFNALADAWGEVTDLLAVRTRAALLLVRHPIRAADAAQLAAAMLVAEGNPGTIEFACLDRELAVAAEREGFRVRTWPGD